jgi:SAM-dependent methyltransferase
VRSATSACAVLAANRSFYSVPRRATDRRAIEQHPFFEALRSESPSASLRASRHRKTDLRVLTEIARLIRRFASDRCRLLEITAGPGLQTVVFRDQLQRPDVPVIYDLEDMRHPRAVRETAFKRVDFETESFPAETASFDIAVWHRELVTLKNAVGALSETVRVLEPGGLLILTVPNLAAIHNRLLLAVGLQPTTLHIDQGDHMRGFAVRSMTRFLHTRVHCSVVAVYAVGLAPLTSALLPRPWRNLGHTIIWLLRKEKRLEGPPQLRSSSV